MRAKEYIAAIRAEDDILILDTLRFAEDIRDPAKELKPLPEQVKVQDKELKMAETLIDSMSAEWNPEDYQDTYTERVHELIERKAEGREVVTESEPPDPTKVVDLFDALSRSVEGGRRKDGAAGKAGGKDGKRSPDLGELSKSDLEAMAREFNIKGRSKMSRAELEDAVRDAGETKQRRKRAS